MDPETLVVNYVTVYKTVREYGGSEEGGWYYNRMSAVCSIPLIEPGDENEIAEITAFLRPRFFDSGSIHSVRGGAQYSFITEHNSRENETNNAPTYE